MRLVSISILLLCFLSISIQVIGQNQSALKFIQNKGQWNDDIDFQADVPGGRVGVSAEGFSVQLLDMAKAEEQHVAGHKAYSEATGEIVDEPIPGHFFKIKLLGANQQARIIIGEPLDGHYNYFIGSDSCQWAAHVLSYASILYEDIYEGIDFRVSSQGNNLKYDFIVEPGADPSQIKLEYDGLNDIQKKNHNLELTSSIGTLSELKPFTYQQQAIEKQHVASEYQLNGKVASFSFPDGYDECQELVIDPLLIFSTYSGSTADNWGSTATPGEHGTLYSAGITIQAVGRSFPATTGAFQTSHGGSFDMAIIKYDSLGSRFLYATYLGGSENDTPTSLLVDENSEELIVLGLSSSPDYPTSSGALSETFNGGSTITNGVLNTSDQWDIVITRLTSEGDVLVGSTFLGGSGNDGWNVRESYGGPLTVNYGDEMRGDVITDTDGNVYVSSVTTSSDFPIIHGVDSVYAGGSDGVLVKMAPDLTSIIWSTYFRGIWL
ncbi:hypothetical protein LVD15_21645 [Fulvivirga maritima]|uniref:DUF7948 domain-containing protein n=1 Tax=Fulvivirga maritima TaxID=2904247 RepID=UPI001F3641EC|nr:hypothetical protein [Fulvivirga maritima]UII25877.1 hypothetical protein LVD15_21645 [Fulvivirga maritima]